LVMGFANLAALCVVGGVQVPSYDSEQLIRLARAAVVSEVAHQAPPAVSGRTMTVKPVFVTIEADGKVLGCRGALVAREKTLQAEIVLAAQGAAAHDPRYRPLTRDTLKHFLVTVTVVEGLDRISDVSGLQPADGLVLEQGDRIGVVLPWEGKNPAIRLAWAYKKAGVAEGSSAVLYKMHAERYRG
jgi:AMMECR1 domain-containing protein